MKKFPQIDLPTIPTDIEMRLESEDVLNSTHDINERISYLYMMTHKALHLTAEASFDTPQLVHAVNTGAKIYEAVSAIAIGTPKYTEGVESLVVLEAAQDFAGSIRSTETLIKRISYAEQRLKDDAPNLTETVTEIAGRHVAHDKVALSFALRGAAAMRGMHIFIDRRLEGLSEAS